jgi:hypothetical protein
MAVLTELATHNPILEGVVDKRTNKRYANSILALLECENHADLELFTEIRPPESISPKTIEELYRERMIELRETHDYLELSWGGGHDSTMLLKVAEQTGISFDSISVQCFGDPTKETSGFNSELSHNYHHVADYLNKSPRTEIFFVDIKDSYKEVIEHHNDYNLWNRATAEGMMDDICRIATDTFVTTRGKSTNGAIITGTGYKNILFNKEHNTWSIYQSHDDVGHPGSTSFNTAVVRFFETPDIVFKVADDTRNWYKNASDQERDESNIHSGDKIWAANTEWMHEEILYKVLKGKIFHDTKNNYGAIVPWQNVGRFTWYSKNPSATGTYSEYYKYINWLNQNLHPTGLGRGGVLGEGIRPIKPITIDF